MKILHISNSDIKGGAARAAYSVHKAQRYVGIDSTMLVQKKTGNDESVVQSTKSETAMFLRRAVDYAFIKFLSKKQYGRFSFPYYGTDKSLNPLVKEADILNLHWINEGYFSFDTFLKLAKLNKPIVWSLHDMWAFTGGCHYTGGCDKFQNGCGECPALVFSGTNDFSKKIFDRKREVFRKLNFTIAASSKWLADEAGKSPLFADTRIVVQPTPVDVGTFKPIETYKAREAFNLPKEKKLVLFVAMTVSDKRKGFHLLKEALKKIKRADTELLILGSADEELTADLPFKANMLGRLSDKNQIAKCYASADLFAAPSLEDNLPNTVLESLACGTPVAAFNIGGMPDMIDHNATGYLAEPSSIDDLANGMAAILEKGKDTYSSTARKMIESTFTPEVIGDNYKKLYYSIT